VRDVAPNRAVAGPCPSSCPATTLAALSHDGPEWSFPTQEPPDSSASAGSWPQGGRWGQQRQGPGRDEGSPTRCVAGRRPRLSRYWGGRRGRPRRKAKALSASASTSRHSRPDLRIHSAKRPTSPSYERGFDAVIHSSTNPQVSDLRLVYCLDQYAFSKLWVPIIASTQFKRRVRTHGGCRRVDHAGGRRGGRVGTAR
jgi:hypothetical protein